MSSVMTLKRYPSQGGMTFGKVGARRMMWSVNNLLPKGGRWVEYLESTGTQWIDTGIVPTESTTIAICFLPTTIDSTFRSVISSRVDYQTDVIGFGMSTQYTSVNFGSGSEIRIERFYNNVDYVITEDKYGITVNGTNTPFTGAHTYGFLSKLNLSLFARNNNGTIDNFFVGKVLSCKIWQNGVLVRSFAPIAIGNTGYMMDILTGDYLLYGNQGTGDFVIGPDAQPPTI